MTNTIEAARGRWREILPALGIPPASLSGKQQPCPNCGGTDRFQFTDRSGDGDFICRMCGAGKGVQLLIRVHHWDFSRAAREVDKVIGNLPKEKQQNPVPDKRIASDAELKRIWLSAMPITPETAAGKYFAKRGLTVGASMSRALRQTIATFHPHAEVMPVLIARYCDTAGNGKQIHQTFLTLDGDKARVEPNRRFMRGPLPKGGAIRLGDPAETMGIAEGIETALSASKLFGMPVWATTSASMLKLWEPPVGTKRVVIFGDCDASYTGQATAYELAHRLWVDGNARGLERRIDVSIPETMGKDFNDVLREVNDARATH